MCRQSSGSSTWRTARTTIAACSPCWRCSAPKELRGGGASRRRPRPQLCSLATAVPERVALLAAQTLELTRVRHVLDPAVVHEGDGENALPAHAGLAADDVVRLGAFFGGQKHSPDD